MEENTIVNEIAFGETANGAAIVQGSFVAQGASAFFVFVSKHLFTGSSSCSYGGSVWKPE